MSTKEELEKMYDNFAESYHQCCIRGKFVTLVLAGLTENGKQATISAAKRGWKKNMLMLDVELAKLGEP